MTMREVREEQPLSLFQLIEEWRGRSKFYTIRKLHSSFLFLVSGSKNALQCWQYIKNLHNLHYTDLQVCTRRIEYRRAEKRCVVVDFFKHKSARQLGCGASFGPFTRPNPFNQGDTKRFRLTLLTNSALVYESQCGGWGGGGGGVSANEYSCAHHVTWSPSKTLEIYTSIFNLCL